MKFAMTIILVTIFTFGCEDAIDDINDNEDSESESDSDSDSSIDSESDISLSSDEAGDAFYFQLSMSCSSGSSGDCFYSQPGQLLPDYCLGYFIKFEVDGDATVVIIDVEERCSYEVSNDGANVSLSCPISETLSNWTFATDDTLISDEDPELKLTCSN